MYYRLLSSNPLTDFDDVVDAAEACVSPYLHLIEEGSLADGAGASFPPSTIQLEAVSRLLWAFIPLVRGGTLRLANMTLLAEAVRSGTDPANPHYWGSARDFDQILVEMPAIALAIKLAPEIFWDPFDEKTKRNLTNWLSMINRCTVPKCNWVLFPLLVNAVLLDVAPEKADRARMKNSIDEMESFYLNDGWYNDGPPEERRSRDYYVPWAYYFFGLIFTTLCPDFDAAFRTRLRKRAVMFAQDYRHWFSSDGGALPYGRSLSYRYAQTAFWAVLPFAELEALPWGEIRGLWARNLRWWFTRPFFSETGLQSVGYAYPNLLMAERYNSPASPLWALQAFLPLAVESIHPFWIAPEQPLKWETDIHRQQNAGMLIRHEGDLGTTMALSAGQWTPGDGSAHNHMAEKYEKFAYSSHFGFHIAVDRWGLDKLAPDNMLLVSKSAGDYRWKSDSRDHKIGDDISSTWNPFSDVEITTTQRFEDEWILREHRIESAEVIEVVEGGFPLPYQGRDIPDRIHHQAPGSGALYGDMGISGMIDLNGERSWEAVDAAPNSNILFPHAVIPVFRSRLLPGKHIIITAVLAHPQTEKGMTIWNKKAISPNPFTMNTTTNPTT